MKKILISILLVVVTLVSAFFVALLSCAVVNKNSVKEQFNVWFSKQETTQEQYKYLNTGLIAVNDAPVSTSTDGAGMQVRFDIDKALGDDVVFNNKQVGLLWVNAQGNENVFSGSLDQNWVSILDAHSVSYTKMPAKIVKRFNNDGETVAYWTCYHLNCTDRKLIENQLFIPYVETVDSDGNSSYQYGMPWDNAESYKEAIFTPFSYFTSWLSKEKAIAICPNVISSDLETEIRQSIDMCIDYIGGAKDGEYVLDESTINSVLSKESLVLSVGDDPVKLSVLFDDVYLKYGLKVFWGSNDNTVANVDSNGVVTPLSPGSCSVRAFVAGVRLNCLVTVSQ